MNKSLAGVFWKSVGVFLMLLSFSSPDTQAQRVVRVSEPDAIHPAEVAIAINPKNPDNIVAASFQSGRPPRPRSASYNYVSMDGGKTWKSIPVEDPKSLTQGDDALYFGNDGAAYHAHLSFVGIRVARPQRAESGILVEAYSRLREGTRDSRRLDDRVVETLDRERWIRENSETVIRYARALLD